MGKTVQPMKGALIVGGKTREQLVEIQCDLNQWGILINERNTGKLYRQFVAFLGMMSVGTRQKLAETSAKHGGWIWAMDAMQPEGDGSLLYVLYEVISRTPVGAIQLSQPSGEALMAWLQPYRELPYPALATLSDGEKAINEALQASWPAALHQRCQAHCLSNWVEPVLEYDIALRQRMRQDMGGLPKAPSQSKEQAKDNQPPLLERQMRVAIRDALYRTSRKPFQWGRLQGYQQLQSIAERLQQLCAADPDNAYWCQLSRQVERTVNTNRVIATQLAEAHQWLLRTSACLRYPPSNKPDQAISGQQIAREMEQMLQEFQPGPNRQSPQLTLRNRLQYLWNSYGEQMLPYYEISGLPPDNLQLEAFFNRLRRHQRRITGRKTTQELNRLGHYQALFTAESEAELLEHMRQVPLETYLDHRQKVNQVENHHRFLHDLNRDPENALKKLVAIWIAQKHLTGSISGADEGDGL
jgi:hypothetical protein